MLLHLLLVRLLMLLMLLMLGSSRLRRGRNIVLRGFRSRRVPREMRDFETGKLSLPDLISSRSASAPIRRHGGNGG